MTSSQKARLARIVSDLCELRAECDAADRFELGIIIIETGPALARPCDPEPTGEFDECIR